MQSDPMGLSAGSNTYNYVGRNPFDGIDPLGLIEWGDYSLPQGFVNTIAGIGDVLSLGGTYMLRDYLKLNNSIYEKEGWEKPNEKEIDCFIERDRKYKTGFYRGYKQYEYNNSYAIAEHYDFSKNMTKSLGIIGLGIMAVEIPGYNISKIVTPFFHDEKTSPPTWLDIKYSTKGLMDGMSIYLGGE